MTEDVRTPALVVWRFGTAAGAGEAVRMVEKSSGSVIDSGNAAMISWTRGTRTPRVEHLGSPAGERPVNEAFWGLFFGLVFFLPLIGAATGETTGTTSRTLADVGIDDTFINKLRDRITPGSSGLVVLVEPDTFATVRDSLPTGKRTEMLFTHLGVDQVRALRSVFGTG